MKEKIKEIIFDSLREFNEEAPESGTLEISEDTVLLDSDGRIDSLDFVALIVIIETNISNKLDKNINIVNEEAFSGEKSPFISVKSLIEFIGELLEAEC